MPRDEAAGDELLLTELTRITNDYGALQRRTAQQLARTRHDLAHAEQGLAMVAHDLRAPLQAVMGFTEILLAGDGLDPRQQDLTRRIERAARQIAELTGELVESVAIGSAPLHPAPVDIAALLDSATSRHELLSGTRTVRLVRAPGDAPPGGGAVMVPGDEAKLERLLDNLISNALKFSPPEGTVRVGLAVHDRDVEISVADDGPGIDPAQQAAVFDPFHRAPGAATVPGIGLGLAIVRQIAERHGGTVTLESEPGAGATFVVRLPRQL